MCYFQRRRNTHILPQATDLMSTKTECKNALKHASLISVDVAFAPAKTVGGSMGKACGAWQVIGSVSLADGATKVGGSFAPGPVGPLGGPA